MGLAKLLRTEDLLLSRTDTFIVDTLESSQRTTDLILRTSRLVDSLPHDLLWTAVPLFEALRLE
jgi:hypothetical protein